MRRTVFLVALVVLAGTAPAVAVAEHEDTDGCTFPVTHSDASGTEVTVDPEPQSVVTLSPSAAQTMWEIGAKGKVVGVTKWASYLDGADEKTNISGGGSTVSNEKVLNLEPDLVLAPNITSKDRVQTLRDAGLTIFWFKESETISDIKDKTQLIGALTGECDGAEDTVAWMNDQLAHVESVIGDRESPDVAYLFFGWTSGDGTFIHEIIQTAGGNNVAAKDGFYPYSNEWLLSEDPDWIVLNDQWDELPDSEPYTSLSAPENGNIVVVDNNLISQPGPRIVTPVVTIANEMHSISIDYTPPQSVIEEARQAGSETETATPTETATATATATETATQTATDTQTATATDASTATATEATDSTATGTDSSDATATESTEPTVTSADTPEPTDSPAATADDGAEPGTTEGDTGPGFGILVALVALALLVLGTRRR